ncbi:alpha-L-arabinofuranosidase domain protein (plasmid) [Haloterrigena turkmenica DSM 5511]|uniref:non-reducing end alpha-L-arabinofuranosidase n=1 Tax=Haloterrigena turkmenica (strain ATCC 51198 / DSM 5511 / JCM 9101 / NCIMB 13204 / VKM B-1734 / 4k) TaxID=543526 RepID=D2S1N4_HALTV|nr:alpha-L-arabinofuranosidase C-terminal domain-containing protein [Haloterrigena turkmenica]ADB63281.1 alpha-L-arabinofuranosidase domain protein [Haloterrigena turkmenica DSM 5511]
MANARITVHTAADIDRIAPEVHGHFSEHLGRCVYEGLWTSDSSEENGFREDVVELLSDLEIPVLRWPGGCFADDYHWEDGVGPQEERPRRRNLFWAQGPEDLPEESNAFGTDEFLQLCERIDTEPYLAANVGSGTPQEAANWVEYCNYDGDTELADRRRDNGHEEPYGVKYWGLGNENWGCGGQMSPEQYAREYRRYATYVGTQSNLMFDHDIELIACGFEGHEWNRRFLEEINQSRWGVEFPLDHLTLHHYYGRGMNVDEADEDQYDRMLVEALEMERHIERMAGAINAVATTRDIGVIIDEWGTWHPEATADNGLEQPGTVLDALSAAAVLDVFNHHSDVLTMTNIAQTVNVLQCLIETDEDEAWARPTYRVFDLYAPHKGSEAVQTSVDTPTRELDDDEDSELPLVGASASVDDDETYVTVTNLDCREEKTIEVALEGVDLDSATIEGELLFADQEPDLEVDADNADEFAAEELDVSVDSDTLIAELPASTVAGISIQ